MQYVFTAKQFLEQVSVEGHSAVKQNTDTLETGPGKKSHNKLTIRMLIWIIFVFCMQR